MIDDAEKTRGHWPWCPRTVRWLCVAEICSTASCSSRPFSRTWASILWWAVFGSFKGLDSWAVILRFLSLITVHTKISGIKGPHSGYVCYGFINRTWYQRPMNGRVYSPTLLNMIVKDDFKKMNGNQEEYLDWPNSIREFRFKLIYGDGDCNIF